MALQLAPVSACLGILGTGWSARWDLITWTWDGHGGTFRHRGSEPVSAAHDLRRRPTEGGNPDLSVYDPIQPRPDRAARPAERRQRGLSADRAGRQGRMVSCW
jgi:hypothetical protein